MTDYVCKVCGNPLDVEEQLEAMRTGDFICNDCFENFIEELDDIEGEA